ncbi:hypothetical protein GTC6_20530, partial [Gordonia terrae C-6]
PTVTYPCSSPQSYFVGLLDAGHHSGSARLTAADYGGFLEHKEEFEARREFLATLQGLPPIQFRPIVTDAADWIKAHVPPFDKGEIRDRDLTHGMKVAYNLGSGTTHGMKWLHEYIGSGRERNLLGMVADGLAAALAMSECAVALFEAQANLPRNHTRNAKYPERLQSTVNEWSRMYPPPASE